MNVEEIIYSNNIDNFKKYSILIKRFILEQLINNEDISKYQNCINYFILTNDLNFHDSLKNIKICCIYLNCVNDLYLCNYINNNEIIISKSLNIFTNNLLLNKKSNKNSFQNISRQINMNIIKEKLNIIRSDIPKNIIILDEIYNEFNINIPIFQNIYNYLKKISINNINEINKRLEYIKILIETIYKLILNDSVDIEIIIDDKENFLNSVRIISLIFIKINNLLIKKSINDNNDDENIDILLNNKENIKEIINIFNKNEDEEFDIKLYKINIINVIKLYKKINFYNNTEFDIVYFLENLINEFIQIKEILESNFYNKIDEYFLNFSDQIKILIKYIDDNDETDNYLLNSFNDIIIDLIINLNKDNNIESIKNQYLNNKNENEKKYLKNQIESIEKLIDINLYHNIKLLYNSINKLNELIILENQLNSQIDEIELDNNIENIKKIRLELIEEIKKYKLNIDIMEIKLKNVIEKIDLK